MIDIVTEAANQYYILEIGLLMLLNRDDVVENLGTEKRNVAGTKFIMKTRDGISDVVDLSGHTPLSHDEAKIEMRKPEWTGE
jgi:hypothetical protein